jgi:rare lipoprotein A (peptidoglycan hydrolase)
VVAAKQLGTYDRGIAKVRIEALREVPVMAKPNLRVPPRPKPSPTPGATAPVESPEPKKRWLGIF